MSSVVLLIVLFCFCFSCRAEKGREVRMSCFCSGRIAFVLVSDEVMF